MKVDVIVLNFNGERFLAPCLDSLRAQTYRDFAVLVVDNGSKDGSLELLRTAYADMRLLALPENLGFCGGNNEGIRATSAEYVVLLNNDTTVEPDWLERLVAAMDAHPNVGTCASLMVRMSDRDTVDTAGDLFFTCGIGGKRGRGASMKEFLAPAEVFGACAGAAMYRRRMLEDIGLLDEDFFATNEDLDLSFRARLRGYGCIYVPAVVYHHVGGSIGALQSRVVRLVRRNMLEVILKNMPAALLFKYAPLILAYFAAGDLFYLLRYGPSAIFGARLDNLRRLRRTLQKRRAIQRGRKISIHALDALLTPTLARVRDAAERKAVAY